MFWMSYNMLQIAQLYLLSVTSQWKALLSCNSNLTKIQSVLIEDLVVLAIMKLRGQARK